MGRKTALMLSCGALAALPLAASGCLVAAAGVVEVSRADETIDPLGEDYVGQNDEIGWYQHHHRPREVMEQLEAGLLKMGCEVRDQDRGVYAVCPGHPHMLLYRDGSTVYRICEPDSERMDCRRAWETVQRSIPRSDAQT